jgi:ribose 5-phosphate isomerase B
LCLGTGIGIGIAANKVVGVRAAVVHDVTTASLARRHNDANVVCLGARISGLAEATDAVDTFFTTAYEGGRHQKRLDEISQYETSRTDPAGATVAGTGDDHERQQPSS